MESKGEIRQRMRLLRRTMKSEARAAASKAICAKLLAREDVRRAIEEHRPIAVYLASPEEVDLADFIRAALSRGASLVAPRWTGSVYELAPLVSLDNLVVGPHNILEPPSATHPSSLIPHPFLWLVPGLAFTWSGKRLGYGGGWYDRLLAAADRGAEKLGVAFGCQVVDDLPDELHDCRLTGLVTDSGR